MKNEKAIEKLHGFRNLDYFNWAGYGENPWYVGEKSEKYIAEVESLMKVLPVDVEVFPLMGGNIVQIEADFPAGYIEFDLNEDHTANGYEYSRDWHGEYENEFSCYWWEIPNRLGGYEA